MNATAIRQSQGWIVTKMLDRSIRGGIVADAAVNQTEQHFKKVVEKFIIEVVKNG